MEDIEDIQDIQGKKYYFIHGRYRRYPRYPRKIFYFSILSMENMDYILFYRWRNILFFYSIHRRKNILSICPGDSMDKKGE